MAGGAAVAGIGLQAAGTYMESQAEADALEANAAAYEEEAKELWRRASINARATQREGGEVVAEQVGAFAMGGVEITAGTPLDVMADTNEKIARQIGYDLEQAALQRKNLETQAAMARKQAKDTRKVGIIKAVGGAALGASKVGGSK